MSIFDGIKVFESPLATMRVSVRKHRLRSGMSAAYHKRIQKKWDKRFGKRDEPCAIFMSPRAVGLDIADRIVIHPERMAILRNYTTGDRK